MADVLARCDICGWVLTKADYERLPIHLADGALQAHIAVEHTPRDEPTERHVQHAKRLPFNGRWDLAPQWPISIDGDVVAWAVSEEWAETVMDAYDAWFGSGDRVTQNRSLRSDPDAGTVAL